MARKQLKGATAKMSEEERDALRAVVVFTSVDDIFDALRTKMPDEEIARVWEGVQKRIAAENAPDATHGAPDTTHGKPPADLPSLGPAPRAFVTLTGPQIALAAVGIFGAGVLAGMVLPALLSRSQRDVPVMIDETRTAPAPTAEQVPEPAPQMSAAPSATSSAASITSVTSSAISVTSSAEITDVLLLRARSELRAGSAQTALELAEEHAQRFPRANAAQRETIAIQALSKLGRHEAAEKRAEGLVTSAPQYRAAMEALLGHRLP